MSTPKPPSFDTADPARRAPQPTQGPQPLPPARPEEDDDERFASQPCTD